MKLIFHIGHSAGFYSEFNNMVLAMLYCQRHGIEFELYSADANFRIKHGWNDFFQPFCKETRNPVHHYINHRFSAPAGGKRKLLYDIYKQLHPTTYLTSELWEGFRHIDQNELSTEETRNLASTIIKQVYQFSTSTQRQVDNLTQSVDLPKNYIGFHIRGGDKSTEHLILSAEVYVTRAEQETNIRTAFVSSDDYRIIKAMRDLYHEWTFYTLTPETNQGFNYKSFQKLSVKEKANDLINMFASIELLYSAERTYCTYSSNIGMFLGMRMGDRAVGVDMNNWMIW